MYYVLKKSFAFFILSLLFTYQAQASDFAQYPNLDISLSQTDSFQLAKTTFLPDKFEDLGFGGFTDIDHDYNPSECGAYPLSSCPKNATCNSCPSNSSKYKFVSCKTGYSYIGGSCLASSCATLGYYSQVPDGKICTKTTEGTLTCYKNCRDVSCSGYTLDCTKNPTNVLSLEKCPDCTYPDAKCGDDVCKIFECEAGYKISADGGVCVQLDDTCPSGYYKECETGTQGDPVMTEAGSRCYQCKPEVQTCPAGQLDLDTYWCDGALRCLLPQVN